MEKIKRINNKKKSIVFTSDDIMLYLILAPFILWYILFAYKPMYGILIAFQNHSLFKGISGSDWIGLENFKTFLTSPYFYTTLKNTIVLNIWSLCLEFPFAIFFALMLNDIRKKLFKTIVQTSSFIPYFISIVVACGITINMLSPSTGIVNLLLSRFGFEKVYFMAKAEYFPPIFTLLNIWKIAGFNAIIYIAALTGIDPTLYEAAKIDGAGKIAQLFSITLPSITPTIVVMLVLKIGNMLNVSYETILLLYQPATYSTSDVISTYVYRTGMVLQDFGLSTAVGLFNAILGCFLVYFANKAAKKITETSLW